jgi:hypothetical protein
MLKQWLARWYRKLPLIRDVREIQAGLRDLKADLTAALAVRVQDLELARHPRYADPARLIRHQAQVSSQNGEDGIIHEIFRRIGTTSRIFAEVGVGDGRQNNTAFLVSQGWKGYWVDGDPGFLAALEREDLPTGTVQSRIALVTRENIADIFRQLGVPEEFDLLSVDIDQNTYYAWEGLRRFRPRVVVVEYNAAVPSDLAWKVRYRPDRTWDRTQNFGASLKAFEQLGREIGYSLVGCDFLGINAFFVRSDLTAGHFVEPFTAENHHEPPRYSLVHRRSHPPSILDRPGPA